MGTIFAENAFGSTLAKPLAGLAYACAGTGGGLAGASATEGCFFSAQMISLESVK